MIQMKNRRLMRIYHEMTEELKMKTDAINLDGNCLPSKQDFFEQIKFPKDTEEKARKSTSYYLTKFDLFQKGETKLGWNWPAFIFGGVWGVYRGLYVIILIELGFIIALHFFELNMRLSHLSQEVRDIYELSFYVPFLMAFIAYRVVLGLKVNLFYTKEILKRIERKSSPEKPFLLGAILASLFLRFVDKGLEKLVASLPMLEQALASILEKLLDLIS